MDAIEILRTVSKLVYKNVKDLAGTAEAASGDFGRGAGGDISRNIDMVAEKTVIDYLKEINFDCVILGEECGRVELSSNPKGFIIMDAIDGSANAVRGMPFFCCSLAFSTEEKLSSVTDAVVTNLSLEIFTLLQRIKVLSKMTGKFLYIKKNHYTKLLELIVLAHHQN